MRGIGKLFLAIGVVAMPLSAFAQPAREGNIYNGIDHQPTAGAVQSQEQAAGIAPSDARERAENGDLSTLDGLLLARAHRDARTAPTTTDNVYGVQPGGVVATTPNSGGTIAH
jgi:hypothetical protein